MKVQMILISILIILAGILPFFGQDGLNILPNTIPTSAPGYSFIIVTVGFISLIYGVLNKHIFGTEKVVLFSVGLMTILGGLLPFIKNFIQLPLPASGPLYSGIIILIGAAGLVYGMSKIG